MSAADRCTIFLPPDSNGPSPQYDTFIISPHAHSSYGHSRSRRRDLKVSGKKNNSADRTGDARCPCNACVIARISCSNPKKIPRRPHYYRAAALLCLQILSEPDVVIKESETT